MKINIKHGAKYYLTITLLFLCPLLYAQPDFEDDVSDVSDVPAAPIDNHIPLVLAITIVVFFYYLRKRDKI
jgi:hypothetical protein